MINKDIIKLASNTSNSGLENKYSHKISLKNSTCGDKITLELIADNKKISSMKYETISCVYCEASASLLAKKIKKFKLKDIKKDFITLKKVSTKKKGEIPKKLSDFQKLFNSDNFNRLKCIFLPFDAVLKALKL
jgi:NifU homolog involved in Fe-S cluster formation